MACLPAVLDWSTLSSLLQLLIAGRCINGQLTSCDLLIINVLGFFEHSRRLEACESSHMLRAFWELAIESIAFVSPIMLKHIISHVPRMYCSNVNQHLCRSICIQTAACTAQLKLFTVVLVVRLVSKTHICICMIMPFKDQIIMTPYCRWISKCCWSFN